MSQPNPATLSLAHRGGVLTIGLHRPEVRNAMSQTMVRELLDALAWAEAGGVRVVVLRGSGGHFSAWRRFAGHGTGALGPHRA